jgi:hypothetical protein
VVRYNVAKLKASLAEPAPLLTIGPGRRDGTTLLIERLDRLPRKSLARKKSRRGWVLLKRDPQGREALRHTYLGTTENVVKHLPPSTWHGPAAIVSSSLFDQLDEQDREQLLESGHPSTNLAPRPTSRLEGRNRARLLAAREALLAAVPCLSSEDIATRRGSTTSNASQLGKDLRHSGKVFAVRHGRSWFYPPLQFDAKGMPHAESALVLAALGADANPWDLMQWLVEPNEWLDGKTPQEAWAKDRRAVVTAAEHAHWGARD